MSVRGTMAIAYRGHDGHQTTFVLYSVSITEHCHYLREGIVNLHDSVNTLGPSDASSSSISFSPKWSRKTVQITIGRGQRDQGLHLRAKDARLESKKYNGATRRTILYVPLTQF
jgi:hypothetical protein